MKFKKLNINYTVLLFIAKVLFLFLGLFFVALSAYTFNQVLGFLVIGIECLLLTFLLNQTE